MGWHDRAGKQLQCPLSRACMPSLISAWRHRPTHGRVWALAAPMILSNISVPLVALVDSTVIGHLPHAHQLGAVAVGASLYTFLAWAMGFLRMGATGLPPRPPGAPTVRRCGRSWRKACCWRWGWPCCWAP